MLYLGSKLLKFKIMNIRFLTSIFILAIALISCNSTNKKSAEEQPVSGHKITVKEVLQANSYTYLLGVENDKEVWIAVPKMMANVGDTYYYNEGLEMKDFESKDLERTFESIYFVQEIKNNMPHAMGGSESSMGNPHHHGKPQIEKNTERIKPAPNGITLAELFGKKDNYNNKKVIIKGKIVKANYGIMNKNWFHLQDGTEGNGLYDLTITSLAENVKEGDILTFEGTISLDKDFGHGYKYDIILEDATLIK